MINKIDPYFNKYKTHKNSKVQEKRCVIYSRVSSKEQLMGDSLKVQYNTCTAFAIKKGFEIAEYFGQTFESAKSDEDRKEFVRMLDFVFDSKNKIDSIIVFNYDRFSRSGLGGIEIISQLMKNDVKVFSAINGLDPDSLEGKLMLVITLLQANIQNVNKSIDTKRKMEAKLRDGKWVHMLPMGYSRIGKEKEIVLNKEGKLIQEGFQLYLKGYTITQVQKSISGRGLPIPLNKWGEMLRNPFYCGVMISVTIEDREPILGLHDAIITQKEFKLIQDRLENISGTSLIDKDITRGLGFKGLIKCSKCGSNFSGYHNKKKDLFYYICGNKECRANVSAIQLNSHFSSYLKDLIPPEIDSHKWLNHLEDFLREIIRINNEDFNVANAHYESVKSKINLLADKLLEGVVTDAIFKDKLAELEVEKVQYLKKVQELEFVSSNPQELANIIFQIAKKSHLICLEGTFYQRRDLLQQVFQSEFFHDKEKGRVRTFSNSKINHLINSISSVYTCKKGVKKAEFLTNSAFG